MKAQIYEKVK